MSEERICRICFDVEESSENKLLHPCLCKGTQKWIHDACLRKWYFMGEENKSCSVCKYEIEIRHGKAYQFVPHDLSHYYDKLLFKAVVAYMYNMYILFFILMLTVETKTIEKYIFEFHTVYQYICLAYNVIFHYYRYIRDVDKKLYWSFLDKELKNILYLHLMILGLLPLVQTALFHIFGIFLLQYTYGPIMYYHYMAIKEMNQLVPVYFIDYKDAPT